MADGVTVRVARAADGVQIQRFMRSRVTWLEQRAVFPTWSRSVPRHAAAIHGVLHESPWHAVVAVRREVPVGRVCVCLEPPDRSSADDGARLEGVLGLGGLCTSPGADGVARHLVDWAARYAEMLGMRAVRLSADCERLRDHYAHDFGFAVLAESSLLQGMTLWELRRPVIGALV